MTVVKKSWLLNKAPQSFRDRHRKCYPWCEVAKCQLPSFFVGFSTTSRSRCQEQSCLKKIGKEALIITYKRHNFVLQTQTAPLLEQQYHAACFFQCQSRGLIPRLCETSKQLKNFSTLSKDHKKYINRMLRREALWEVNSKQELNQFVRGKKMPVIKKARVLPKVNAAQKIKDKKSLRQKTSMKRKRAVKATQKRKSKTSKSPQITMEAEKDNSTTEFVVQDKLEKKAFMHQPMAHRQGVILRPASFGSFAVYRPRKRKSANTNNLTNVKKKPMRKKSKKKTFDTFNAWVYPDDDWKPE